MRISFRVLFIALLGPLAVFIPPAESRQLPQAPERAAPAPQSATAAIAAPIRDEEQGEGASA